MTLFTVPRDRNSQIAMLWDIRRQRYRPSVQDNRSQLEEAHRAIRRGTLLSMVHAFIMRPVYIRTSIRTYKTYYGPLGPAGAARHAWSGPRRARRARPHALSALPPAFAGLDDLLQKPKHQSLQVEVLLVLAGVRPDLPRPCDQRDRNPPSPPLLPLFRQARVWDACEF